MLEEYRDTQPIAYKIIKNSIKKNKISHAYLIESNGYLKKMDFAIAFAKFLLCPEKKCNQEDCNNCSICRRIDNRNFTELQIIEPDGLWIKKEQLENLQAEFSKKAIESQYKIYIVNGIEKLNISAANSILKFLEEPEDDIIAILVTDNIYQILKTITSRCQIISLQKNELNIKTNLEEKYSSSLKHLAKHYSTNEETFLCLLNDSAFSEQIQAVINFATKYETIHKNIFTELSTIWNPYFNDKEKLTIGLELLILYYKDLLNAKLERPIENYCEEQENLLLFAENNSQKNICEKIKIIIDIKNRIKFNANIQLLIDKLILRFEEVVYDKGHQSIF